MARNEARTPDAPRTVYRCISGFATAASPGGVPPVWGYGDEVFDDHPILKTVHRKNFEAVHDQVLRREQTTVFAAQRQPTPTPPPQQTYIEQENSTDAQV